jgi:hypothetical protein
MFGAILFLIVAYPVALFVCNLVVRLFVGDKYEGVSKVGDDDD